MAVLLVAMAVMLTLMTVAMPVWRQQQKREREEELLFRLKQYAHALVLYQRRLPGAAPANLDDLVKERFLRRKYKDPDHRQGLRDPARRPGIAWHDVAVAGHGDAPGPAIVVAPGANLGARAAGGTGPQVGSGPANEHEPHRAARSPRHQLAHRPAPSVVSSAPARRVRCASGRAARSTTSGKCRSRTSRRGCSARRRRSRDRTSGREAPVNHGQGSRWGPDSRLRNCLAIPTAAPSGGRRRVGPRLAG